jgi:hypothetical protein
LGEKKMSYTSHLLDLVVEISSPALFVQEMAVALHLKAFRLE